MNSRRILLICELKYWLISKLSQSDVLYARPDANAGDMKKLRANDAEHDDASCCCRAALNDGNQSLARRLWLTKCTFARFTSSVMTRGARFGPISDRMVLCSAMHDW